MHKRGECRDRILVVFAISVIILLSFSFTYHPRSPSTNIVLKPMKTFSHSLIPHDPISITNDDDFKKLGFDGNGTEVSPYLIKDLSIENDDDDGTCISIVSTSAFFIIQNCELLSDDDRSGAGVHFEKVVNGAVVDCNIYSLDVGISVLKSEKCEFKSNSLSRLGKGIYIAQSLWMSIDSNDLRKSGYGIHLYKIDNSELIANNLDECDYGVLIENGVEITTHSNQITGSFFGLYFHNTIRCESISNLIHSSRYGVYFAYSQECNISLSELSRNKYGVTLLEVDGGVISSNLVKTNSKYGIQVKNSRDIEIVSNTVFENSGVGVHLNGVSGASIQFNEIGFNSGGNAADFVGTATKGLVNNWDTNAWSDFRGTPNYSISGNRGSFDNDPHYILYLDSLSEIIIEAPASAIVNWTASALRPSHFSITLDGVVLDEGVWEGGEITASFTTLDPGTYMFTLSINTTSGITASDVVIVKVIDSTPPEWVQVPQDQIIECGSPLVYRLQATDYYGIDSWWVNNTEFRIDHGFLQSLDSLDYGIYHLEVRAYDPFANYLSHLLTITVTDTVSPSVDSPDDVVFLEGETGYAIVWSVYDCNPLSYEILRDGTSIESGEWTSELTFIQYSLDDLLSGTYVFSIILTDVAGNTVSDDVQVIVEVSPITETETPTTEPSTESPTATEPIELNMFTLSLIGLGAGATIVLLLILVKRK